MYKAIMHLNEFDRLHPFVSFIYFAAVIGFSMFFLNPVCLALSLFGGFLYSAVLTRGASVKKNALMCLTVILLTALINPLFSHRGVTVIAYLPDRNPLTAESIAYGAAAGSMIAAVICWFSCFNIIMTGDKLMCIFGRFIPALSLIFSMTLRFVPNFKRQLKKISQAQECFYKENSNKKYTKIKSALSVLSAMVTWALENGIETADSMKNRGYGTKKRSEFSNYRINVRDLYVITAVIITALIIVIGTRTIKFVYFPKISGTETTGLQTAVYTAYALLCVLPIIIELWEECRWRIIKSKI